MTRWPLSLAILTALVSAANRAAAQRPPCAIALQVSSVLASNTNQGTDPRLIPISHELKSAFPYTTYRLLSSRRGNTSCGGDEVVFPLPGGRVMRIEPRGIEGGMISMRLSVFQAKTRTVVNDVKVDSQGVLMAGPRYGKGVVITSIRAESPELATRPLHAPAPASRLPAVP